MTIAAGFKFNGGILLCADTEQTHGGVLKVSGSKLITTENFGGQAQIVLAVCGAVHCATMATQEIVEQIKDTDLSYQTIRKSVKRVLREVFKSDIYPNPLYPTTGGDTFNLLIAVWTKDEKLHLLSSSETSVRDIPDRACIGAGLYLANYLLSLVPDQPMSRSDVEFWAVHVLQQVKKHVPGCGGESEYVFLDYSGKIEKRNERNLSLKEEDVTNLNMMLPSVLTMAANLESPDNVVGGTVDLYKEMLFVAREERRKRIEAVRRVTEYMKRKAEEQR